MAKIAQQSQARLTKFIRLVVYGYLTFDETVKKAASLSTTERTNLKESEIARAGKVFTLPFSRRSRPTCLLKNDLLEQFYKRIETRVQLAERLEISIYSNLQNDGD